MIKSLSERKFFDAHGNLHCTSIFRREYLICIKKYHVYRTVYALSNVEDNQITRRFLCASGIFQKSNINDHYRAGCYLDPSVRDFAIVCKTPAHFGIYLMAADWGNVHRKPRRLISDQRISALLNFQTCRSLFHFSPFYRPRAHSDAVPPLLKFVLFCARSNFISFTPGFPRAAACLIRTYYSLGRGRQNCF